MWNSNFHSNFSTTITTKLFKIVPSRTVSEAHVNKIILQNYIHIVKGYGYFTRIRDNLHSTSFSISTSYSNILTEQDGGYHLDAPFRK